MRKIGKQYMIVESSCNGENETNVYTLNSTAAYLWEKIGEAEFEEATLVDWLCEKYDIDATLAQKDVAALLEEWKSLGLVL